MFSGILLNRFVDKKEGLSPRRRLWYTHNIRYFPQFLGMHGIFIGKQNINNVNIHGLVDNSEFEYTGPEKRSDYAYDYGGGD
jgi:hypothetical protein